MESVKTDGNPTIEALFKAGAHFGYSRSKRHPSTAPYIFGVKNRVEIFDLEKTVTLLTAGEEILQKAGTAKSSVLFVGGKHEATSAVKAIGERLGQPYVAGRWLGGTLTNFKNIRGRVERLLELTDKREKGELAKFTKKERLMIDREITRLERMFSGLIRMTALPKLLVVVDSGYESTAVEEARGLKIPVVAISNSDCDLRIVNYPIAGNDASRASIIFFLEQLASAYEEGLKLSAPVVA